MAASVREELRKALKLTRKRHDAELTAETQALNDTAAVAVKEIQSKAKPGSTQ